MQRCGVASPAPHPSFTPIFRLLQPLSHSTTPPLPHNPALSNLHPHPNPHALNPGMARAPNVLNTVMQVALHRVRELRTTPRVTVDKTETDRKDLSRPDVDPSGSHDGSLGEILNREMYRSVQISI